MRDCPWLALPLVLAWMLAGCGGNDTSSSRNAPGATPTPAPASQFALQLSDTRVAVPEGGEPVSVGVSLSAAPGQPLALTVEPVTFNTNLSLAETPNITFTDENWHTEQSVFIKAAQDADRSNSTVTFRFSVPGTQSQELEVVEIDDDQLIDTGLVQVDADPLEVKEGERAALRVRLTQAPSAPVTLTASATLQTLRIVGGSTLRFDARNWNQDQTIVVAADRDADGCNGRGILRLLRDGAEQRAITATLLDVDRPSGVTNLVCGTIAAPEAAVIDSDVNDPRAPYASNDDPTRAQKVPNPVTIGGYVNVAGSGVAGRSQSSGDASDFYTADFVAGQSLVLHIAQPRAADLDLYLYDETGTLVDASLGRDAVEALNIPSTGQYWVEVYACSVADNCSIDGGSNYLLTFGQVSLVLNAQTLALSGDFVPGEVVAQWRDDHDTPVRALATPRYTIVAGDPRRGALIQVPSVNDGGALKSLATGRRLKFANTTQQAKLATLMTVKQLRAQADVAAADPNYRLQPLLVPNDPLYGTQWHFAQINLPQAWDMTTGSDQVIVAVIDTGVLLNHPDLQGKLVEGYDFIRDPDSAGDGESLPGQTGDLDANPNDPGDRGGVAGSSFHGTHTSGTVAAASDNGLGVSGVAWSAKVMPLRALGRAGGTEFDAQEAMRFAAGLPNSSGTVPAKRADVVNMSFGGPRFSQTMANLIAELRAAGVIIVAAAGNDGNASPMYPAAYPGVVSVSAVDFDRNLAGYSNFGSSIDVAAPGGDTRRDRNGDGVGDGVLSTGGSDTSGAIQFRYPVFQGTSMAAPHVAGVVALMKSIYAGLTPEIFDNLLASGRITQDIGAAGRDDQFGYGLIDAFKTVREASALAGGTDTPPAESRLVVLPAMLNFGATLASAQFSVDNGGSGALTVRSVTSDQPWLTVAPSQVDGGGRGTYSAQVDRADLSPGIYTGTIRVVSNAGDASLSVITQVRGEGGVSDAGLHHIVLYEPASHRVVSQTTADAQNGMYHFTLTNAPPGVYHLFAGTDSNQDGFLCDPGEACGAFTTLAQPSRVVIDGEDVEGVDFTTNFVLELPGIPSTVPAASMAPALSLP